MPSKLEKFAALEKMENVYQNFDFHHPQLLHTTTPINMKGLWHQNHFKNNNPIILELACGRGEYSVALGEKFPNKNFIGVDVKGNRIFSGATMAKEKELPNVAFLRTYIQLLHHFFEKDEISEIWITFPDPFPRKADRMNRLISTRFLDYYKSIFNKNILMHLKTDNLPLFRYALGVLDGRGIETVSCVEDIYNGDKKVDDILKIQTYYEKLHKDQGAKINYLSFLL